MSGSIQSATATVAKQQNDSITCNKDEALMFDLGLQCSAVQCSAVGGIKFQCGLKR